jgi:single-strand DNA-binding protein
MARDLNSTLVVGRLTRDPDYKVTQSGAELLTFSIANNRVVGSGQSQREEVSYFDVTLWGKFATVMKDYLSKGKQVIVQGRLIQQRWDQDGQTRSKVIIAADNLQLLGGADGGQQQQGQDPGPNMDDIPF